MLTKKENTIYYETSSEMSSEMSNEINSEVSSEVSSETCSNISCQSYCKLCDPKCKYFDCICNEAWKEFDKIFQKIQEIESHVLLEKLRISTITLCFNLNSNIDTEKLSKKYISKNNGKFYNSLVFNWHTKYQAKTVVSVKIFPNGKVQVAGLCNIKSCAYIIRKVNNKCKEFYENKNSAFISDTKIAMINSDFKLNKSLNLTDLCDTLSNYSVQQNGNFLSIVYQPIKYPAINTKFICDEYLEEYNKHVYLHNYKKKFTKTVSILIFRSGSIIITGGNDINNYLSIYEYLIKFINLNLKKITID